jgi:hypothetical protein
VAIGKTRERKRKDVRCSAGGEKYLRLAGEIVCGGGGRGIRGGRTGSGGLHVGRHTSAPVRTPLRPACGSRSPSSFATTPPIPSLTFAFTFSPQRLRFSLLFIERTHSTTAVSNHTRKPAAVSSHPKISAAVSNPPPKKMVLFQQFIST